MKGIAKKIILLLDLIFIALGILGFIQIQQKSDLPLRLVMSNNHLMIINSGGIPIPGFIPEKFEVIAVNGQEVFTKEDVEFVCDGLHINSEAQVDVRANGMLKTISIKLIPFYGILYIIILLFLCILIISVAVIVIVKRPIKDKSAWTFHFEMLMVYCLLSMTWGNYIFPNLSSGVLIRLIFSFAYSYVPVFFVWFTFVFPKEKWDKTERLITILGFIAMTLSIGMGYSFFKAATERSLLWFNIYKTWFDICRVFFAVSIIFSVFNLGHSYKYAAEESDRRKLRWIFLGALIGPLSFVLLWQIPQLFTSSALIPEELMLLFTAAVPLTFGFSIVRYHAFDIDLLFKRSTIYGTLLLIIITVYAILVGGFTILIGELTVLNSVVLSAAASVISVLMFQPIRNSVKKFVDKKFFVVQYSFSEVQVEITDKLDKCLQVQEVAGLIISEINKILPLQCTAFILFNNDEPGSKVIFADRDESSVQVKKLPEIRFEKAIPESLIPVFIENSVEKGISILPAKPNEFGDSMLCGIIPIGSTANTINAVLLVGKKRSEFVFSYEDITLLTFICGQAAAAIVRIDLYKNLLYEKTLSAKLKELNEIKSFFVSSVSHELKTPLTSIKMFSEILRNSKQSSEKQEEYLSIIEGESDRLTRLINNVLDFAKIEKGIKEYNFTEVDLVLLVKDVLRMMQYQLKMHSFKTSESYACIECPILADKDAVIEACMNLISNAIKYSDLRRSLQVSLEIREDIAVLTFRDEGIGIPEEKLTNIFEPYVRVKSIATLHAGGTGLGLAIVKHIMVAHKGQVEVQSRIGEGSAFSLIFPLIKNLGTMNHE
jgi:signal transduction histidine kinase